MHVLVNGVRLFFDVEGAKLVPDGPVMRERPTLLLLHGGPGFDHTIYKPAYSALADIAQVIYLDHRGNGRSDARSEGELDAGAMGRRRPRLLRRARHRKADRARRVVRRHGGDGVCDAASVASRQADPDHHRGEGRVVSRKARRVVRALRRARGRRAGAAALLRGRRVQPDEAAVAAWRRLAMPHYTRTPRDADAMRRAIIRPDVLQWFHAPGRTRRAAPFDMLPDLQPHPVPDAGDGRRGRSDAPDRGPGRDRCGVAAAPRSLRTVFRLRTWRDSRISRNGASR